MMDQMKNLGQRKTSLERGELETDTKNPLVSVNTETHREGSISGKRRMHTLGTFLSMQMDILFRSVP